MASQITILISSSSPFRSTLGLEIYAIKLGLSIPSKYGSYYVYSTKG